MSEELAIRQQLLTNLTVAANRLIEGYAESDPTVRSQLWRSLVAEVRAAEDCVYPLGSAGKPYVGEVPDDRPLRCPVEWDDQLDAVRDRCGMPKDHDERCTAAVFLSDFNSDHFRPDPEPAP